MRTAQPFATAAAGGCAVGLKDATLDDDLAGCIVGEEVMVGGGDGMVVVHDLDKVLRLLFMRPEPEMLVDDDEAGGGEDED
jgi:hypothetical protein